METHYALFEAYHNNYVSESGWIIVSVLDFVITLFEVTVTYHLNLALSLQMLAYFQVFLAYLPVYLYIQAQKHFPWAKTTGKHQWDTVYQSILQGNITKVIVSKLLWWIN